MFCPVCKDEFRPGFTRCADCDADLVESLDAAPPERAARPAAPPAAATVDTGPQADPVASAGPAGALGSAGGGAGAGAAPRILNLVDYCGFLSLEDAREARDLLRAQAIACEIVIREAPDVPPDEPLEEEFWIRVDRARYAQASALLGFDEDGSGD